jgi:ABC-type sulfate transport system substrate-binding protein
MAYDFHKKNRSLSLKDILNPEFQAWMNSIETATTGMSNSTGNMMRDMVLRGPSTFDALCVYENVFIDHLKNAEGRWGSLRVAYPSRNAWNDNPYFILDAPWSSADQRAAAGEFLDYLLSEPIQRESLKHGFRPGNPAVPIKFPESPFVVHENAGLRIDLGEVCESPKAEVLNNLLAIWQRSQGAR